MNRFLLAAAALAAFTSVVHLIGGGRDIAEPLLNAPIDETLKQTLYVVWHSISLTLAGSAIALGLAALPGRSAYMRPLVLFVALLWLAFGVLFLIVAATQSAPFWNLPQWLLLMPVGLLAWWGQRPTPSTRSVGEHA